MGTEEDSIIFTSGQAVKDVLDWNGIKITGSGGSDRVVVLQYCDIGYGGNSSKMINIEYTYGTVTPMILNCHIHHSSNYSVFT